MRLERSNTCSVGNADKMNACASQLTYRKKMLTLLEHISHVGSVGVNLLCNHDIRQHALLQHLCNLTVPWCQW